MKLWKILLPVSMTVLGAPGVQATCLGSAETANCSISPNAPNCVGTSGDDVIICDSSPCVVSGGGGSDLVLAAVGNDKICVGPNGLSVAEGLAGNDQLRGTGDFINGLDIFVLSGGSGNDVASLAGNADDVNALLGGLGFDINQGSVSSTRDVCSSGDLNTNCEITVTN